MWPSWKLYSKVWCSVSISLWCMTLIPNAANFFIMQNLSLRVSVGFQWQTLKYLSILCNPATPVLILSLGYIYGVLGLSFSVPDEHCIEYMADVGKFSQDNFGTNSPWEYVEIVAQKWKKRIKPHQMVTKSYKVKQNCWRNYIFIYIICLHVKVCLKYSLKYILKFIQKWYFQKCN